MKNSLSKVTYLISALLMFALSGCGSVSNTVNESAAKAPGLVAVELTKSTAKSVAATVATTTLVVTGATIPTAKANLTGSTGGTLEVYPGTDLIVSAYGYDSTGALIYEGFATRQTVKSGVTTTVTIQLAPPVVKAENAPCLGCHANTRDINGQNLVANYKQSGHYFNNISTNKSANGGKYPGCAGCHGVNHNVVNPATGGGIGGASRCSDCHGNNVTANINANHDTYTGGNTKVCAQCHIGHNLDGAADGCVGCHAITQDANTHGSYVNDNNGVRAVTGEFSKTSHHVTGKTLTNSDCAVCHLEGTASGAINLAYHMKDNKIHLRNGNPTVFPTTNSANNSEFLWDPANPDHTAMDNFCMSCHNAAGATAAVGLVAGNNARNPFNDTISNGYDQMSRTYVVAVYEQFDTGNTSHHAVRGKKYQGRTRAQSEAIVGAGTFTRYSGAVNAPAGAIHPRANATVNSVFQYFGNYSTQYGNTGYGPKSPGSRKTIYEAGLFTSLYTTLNGTVVGDDSTLHCGDCHTVGQFKPGSAKAVAIDGTIITAPDVIGAHGSNNEYLLRNSIGTDALMKANSVSISTSTAATYLTSGTAITYDLVTGQANNLLPAANNGTQVCYLCHKQVAYSGNIAYFNWLDPLTGVAGATATRHGGVGGGDCVDASRDATGKVGSLNRVGAVASSPSGNKSTILGNVCSNCHNSGNQIFGGVHGNASSYGDTKNVGYKTYSTNGKDVATNVLAGYSTARGGRTENRNQRLSVVTRAPYRFMGGASLKYSGGGSADKWEAKVLTTQHREGCYNISTTTTGLNQWSAKDGSTAVGAGTTGVPNYSGATPSIMVPPIVSGSDDLGYTATSGTGAQNVNSGADGSWGACGHHTGSASAGTSNMPKRTVQRPLKY